MRLQCSAELRVPASGALYVVCYDSSYESIGNGSEIGKSSWVELGKIPFQNSRIYILCCFFYQEKSLTTVESTCVHKARQTFGVLAGELL